jgi:PPOX class probable FMN-dependent enzyme
MLTDASWQTKLARALTRNRAVAQSRYFQLATIDADGSPNCRTMVYRGFTEDGSRLDMHTDLRSNKISQLQYPKLAEICWYFPHTREQFRLKGNIELICSPDHPLGPVRTAHWQSLSNEVQASYVAVSLNAVQSDAKVLKNSLQLPSEHFALLQLTAKQVDHLQLQPLPHKRWLYQRDNENSWQSRPITP